MSLTPRDSTRKKSQSRDWCIRYLPESDDTSPEALAVLKCLFYTISEPNDSVPTEFTEKVKHLLGSQETGAPYTGYYMRLNNALVLVSNVYRVWFEVHVWGNKFECFQLAQSELRLKNNPLLGINFELLEQSRIPTQPPTWAPSQIETRPREAGSGLLTLEQLAAAIESSSKEPINQPLTPFNDPSSNEDDDQIQHKRKDPFGSFGVQSSCTARNKPPHWPCGTGDDPFSLANLPEDKEDKARHLEGIHPDKYNGDCMQTTRFLNMFNWFMLMNYKADIAKDPIRRTLYFLSLLEGPKCKGWVNLADK